MKVSIIGAGNGGQAIAAYLSIQGCDVSICDTDSAKIEELKELGYIRLQGRIEGVGKVSCFTTDVADIIPESDIVMVTTTANAHHAVAKSIAPFVKDNQIIILNPGRTCGALVFKQALKEAGCSKRYFLGEAQTLVYACRLVKNGVVNIIGVKDEVLLSALPASDTKYILRIINKYYPCFIEADKWAR